MGSTLTILMCLSATPVTVASQTPAKPDAVVIEEVVVTARRRAESLQKVPAAVTVFPEQRLADAGIDDLKSLVQLVPGAMTADIGAAFSNEIVIRGQGAGRNINAEPATGIYRNGIYVAGGNAGGRNFNRMDLFDVERIEVLRGPQGALYGRNAVGGAINVVSRRPNEDHGYELRLGLGENERYEAHAIANVPLSEQLAVRAGLKYFDQSEGFFTDPTSGDPQDIESFFGGRLSTKWTLNDALEGVLTVERFEDEGPSFTIGTFNPLSDVDPYAASATNFPFDFDRRETTALLELTVDFDAFDLISVTLYKDRDVNTYDDVDAFLNIPPAGPQSLTRTSSDDFRRFGQELRLASSEEDVWVWLIGAEFSDSADDFLVINNNGARTSVSESDDLTLGLFGSLGRGLTEKANITAELRYTYSAKDVVLTSRLSPVANERREEFSETFDNFSPKLTFDYSVSEDTTVYASIATGYRAGGFNPEPDNAEPVRFTIPYDEETTVSWEAGVKSRIDETLTLNLAGFISRTDDLQLIEQFPPAGGGAPLNVLRNAGESRQYGLEAELSYRRQFQMIGATMSLNASGSWADADVDSTLEQFDGRALPYLRDFQFNTEVVYRQPLTESSTPIHWFASYTFRGGFGGYQDEATERPLDDIRLHDIRFGLEATRWSVIAAVENVFDEFYVPQRISPTSVRASQPRTWLLSLSVFY